MRQSQKGFSVLEILLLLIIVGILVGTGWYVWQAKNNADKIYKAASSLNNTVLTKKSSPTQVQTNQQTIATQAKIPGSNFSSGIYSGTAIISPNAGEGVSVQYSQTINGYTYHPFRPLEHHINSQTKITDRNNKALAFSNVRVGDSLVVHMSNGPCSAGSTGQPSGCDFQVYSIQDYSYPRLSSTSPR